MAATYVLRVTCITHQYPATIIDPSIGVFCPTSNPGEFRLYEPNLSCMSNAPGEHSYICTPLYEPNRKGS